MPRNLNDMPAATARQGVPDSISPGEYRCRCTGVESGKSPKRKTPRLTVHWRTAAYGQDFSDDLYITPRTLSRLVLVAKRVCGAADMQLPDDDGKAAIELAKYINANIVGKDAIVTIENETQTFIAESGPNVGQKQTSTRRKVAFAGYDRLPEHAHESPASADEPLANVDEGDEIIPF